MVRVNRYQATGFYPISVVHRVIWYEAAAVTIAKGDVLHDDGNGYATNATTAFTHSLLGVAAAACDNGSGAAGADEVAVIPWRDGEQFIVPVEENAVITQTAVGTLVDLESVNTIDINDTVTDAPGFFIDEIDAGTDAVAANTYGYAIGRFKVDS